MQIIQDSGRVHPEEGPRVTPSLTIDMARQFATGLEVRDQARFGGPREKARERVARRVGVAPGTLETLIRGRLKRLEAWVFARLAAAAVADLNGEIARHEHELALAQSCIPNIDASEVREVEASLAALRGAVQALGTSERPAVGRGRTEVADTNPDERKP